jgi:hypothetical protein
MMFPYRSLEFCDPMFVYPFLFSSDLDVVSLQCFDNQRLRNSVLIMVSLGLFLQVGVLMLQLKSEVLSHLDLIHSLLMFPLDL